MKAPTFRQLINLGIPRHALDEAVSALRAMLSSGSTFKEATQELQSVQANPEAFLGHPVLQSFARAVYVPPYVRRESPAPWQQWGSNLDEQAIKQMINACSLPVAVAGALMPDAHVGYGLPIGGVLATDNSIIPFAVGVDIACRMRLTVFDLPGDRIAGQRDRLANILESETRFGVGAVFQKRWGHPVMDEDWSICAITAKLKDKAWAQLGTSGSGNHFVEFGLFIPVTEEAGKGELPKSGEYLALLSHSGSRGAGACVCQHYSQVAMSRQANLPKELKHLAWLELDSEPGQEYWSAMNLMGRYAAANHEIIHKQIARAIGARILFQVENHHNFAWKEVHNINGKQCEVVVHRKGATPAGQGILGVIPGSMATPGFLVRGRGCAASLESASHGAGRVMSRSQALSSFSWSAVKKELAAANVHLLSAGLDEVPGVYKNIENVMAAQTDLVDILGVFQPRIVKMCPAGERAED